MELHSCTIKCLPSYLELLPLQILNENNLLWNVISVEYKYKRGIASLCGPECKRARTCMKIGNSRFCAALSSIGYLPFAQLVAADELD